MKDYIVVFMKKGLSFYERNLLYAGSRAKAIQTVREHYGRGAMTIISVLLAENAYR